jgi:hypothetical protein
VRGFNKLLPQRSVVNGDPRSWVMMNTTHQRQDECRQRERRQTQRAWVGNLTQTRVDRSWGRIFVVVDARALFDVVVEGRHEWLVCRECCWIRGGGRGGRTSRKLGRGKKRITADWGVFIPPVNGGELTTPQEPIMHLPLPTFSPLRNVQFFGNSLNIMYPPS